VTLGPLDVVRLAEAFGAKGLKIEQPARISSAIKKALEMQGPVIAAMPLYYKDNHWLMEIVQPEALD
jgi:acetolactate synthase I/II/III large subunit